MVGEEEREGRRGMEVGKRRGRGVERGGAKERRCGVVERVERMNRVPVWQ